MFKIVALFNERTTSLSTTINQPSPPIECEGPMNIQPRQIKEITPMGQAYEYSTQLKSQLKL